MKFRAMIVLAAAAMLSACGINSVPTAEENAKARWADVQAAYQRRADTIPNIVATVKGSAASEGKILTDVINARANATRVQVNATDLTDPNKIADYQRVQTQLGASLGRRSVVLVGMMAHSCTTRAKSWSTAGSWAVRGWRISRPAMPMPDCIGPCEW